MLEDNYLYAITMTTIYHSKYLRDDEKSGFYIVGNTVFSKKERALAYMRHMVDVFCPKTILDKTYYHISYHEDEVICRDKPGVITVKFKVERLYKDMFND